MKTPKAGPPGAGVPSAHSNIPALGWLAVSLACLPMLACKKETDKAAPPPTLVKTMQVMQRDMPIKKDWIGVLDGDVNAVIRAQVTGYLTKQCYQEGDAVKKGQLLFEIDPRPFQAALDQATANLAQQEATAWNATANRNRVEPLAKKGALSQSDLDNAISSQLQAQAQVEAAKAAIEKARLDLGFTKITSPIDGIAGIAEAQLGDLVGPSSQGNLTTVSRLDPIKAYFNVSEEEYLKAADGKRNIDDVPVQLLLTNGSEYPHPGKVTILNRQVDPTTGTIKVAAEFPNEDNKLRPGQYGRVRATVRIEKGALLVPQRAVTDYQGQYLVAIVEADNKIRLVNVEAGDKVGSDWIIRKGLKPADQIVVEGTQKVRDGMTVTTEPFEQKAATPSEAPSGKK